MALYSNPRFFNFIPKAVANFDGYALKQNSLQKPSETPRRTKPPATPHSSVTRPLGKGNSPEIIDKMTQIALSRGLKMKNRNSV